MLYDFDMRYKIVMLHTECFQFSDLFRMRRKSSHVFKMASGIGQVIMEQHNHNKNHNSINKLNPEGIHLCFLLSYILYMYIHIYIYVYECTCLYMLLRVNPASWSSPYSRTYMDRTMTIAYMLILLYMLPAAILARVDLCSDPVKPAVAGSFSIYGGQRAADQK